MQDAWKKEIAEVLQELRLKEKVSGLRQKKRSVPVYYGYLSGIV